MKRLLLCLFLTVGVAGCGDTLTKMFGEATTPDQQAFRKAGEYVYISTPARNYVSHPKALGNVVAGVCAVDRSTYEALMLAVDSLRMGLDGTSVALLEASSALASFSFEVFSDFRLPDSISDVAERSVIWATVGLLSAAEMRQFRKLYLKIKLEAMVASGRSPTEAEWKEVMDKAIFNHEAIQTSCTTAS